ncbi:MAG: Snf7 family protein [Thaumarchaeota archaeon]|nr:Snf7 family protein [Nitrososphaerota archaeon]
MVNFSEKWQKATKDSDGIGSKLVNGLRSTEPLKPKLELASRQIQIQVVKLDQASAKLREKDAGIFSKIVSSMQRNDDVRASMLANELSEVRKMNNVVSHAKLALEQLNLRLSTIQELGDLANTLAPAIDVIRGVQPGLINLVPDAEREIGEISGLLSGILVDAGNLNPGQLTFEPTSDEAEKVIEEAGAIVEQRMRSKFPDVPEETDSLEAETA